jgi:FtsH-binding integral membrane protein
MQPESPMMVQGRTATTPALAQNRVLRNTYLLLAISMLPTIAGAWLGVATGFSFFAGNPVIGIVMFLAIAFGFMFAINKTKDSAAGVAVLLAVTFFMGLMLSGLLGAVLRMADGARVIALAFGGTAAIFATMATLAGTIKRDLGGMGKFLTIGAVLLIVGWVAFAFLQIPGMYIALALLGIVIFSAFMLYDLQRIINGGETNYITATLALYLDIFNVFQNLLALLGIGGSSD